MQGSNTKKLLVLATLVVFLLTMINLTKYGKANLTPMESALKDFIAPLQGIAMNVGHRLRGLVSFPLNMVNMSEENQLMKDKIMELEGQLKLYGELESENERLKTLLDFDSIISPVMGYNLTTASVIGRDVSNWFSVITLNKGSAHGFKVNMVVLNQQGLVGRIISVTQQTSDVLLITDPRSGVAALVQENRAPGMVEGVASALGNLKMVHIPLGSELNTGQVVISSSFGSLFPKGIPIGKITAIEQDPSGLFINASITPFADINKLEEVMIIMGFTVPSQEDQIAKLPYPWGNGEHSPKTGGRSPGSLSMAAPNEVVVR